MHAWPPRVGRVLRHPLPQVCIGLLCGGLSAYHGYKRNNSAGWAVAWYFFGAWLPFIALPVAFAIGRVMDAFNPPKGSKAKGEATT